MRAQQVISAVIVSLTLCFDSVWANGYAARPTGLNCELRSVPATAGEETWHGALIQVYPRIADMGPKYNGCQAVFMTTISSPIAKLAWFVEIVDGDMVRIWPELTEVRDWLDCRFRRGVLTAGDSKVCNRFSPLIHTVPAGCTTGTRDRGCEYD